LLKEFRHVFKKTSSVAVFPGLPSPMCRGGTGWVGFLSCTKGANDMPFRVPWRRFFLAPIHFCRRAQSLAKLRLPIPRKAGWKTLTAATISLAAIGTFAVDWHLRYLKAERNRLYNEASEEYVAAMGVNTEEMKAWFLQKLEVGTPAPDFVLPAVRNLEEVHLREVGAGKPVVLLFGSFSCNLFCNDVNEVEELYQQYKNRAEFLTVYITEAGHSIAGLEYVLKSHHPGSPDPRENKHLEAIRRAIDQRGLTMPFVIDGDDRAVERAYLAWPRRLVVIDSDGNIAQDLGRGFSDRWDLKAVAAWLKTQL
jgi:peroxiredoxin